MPNYFKPWIFSQLAPADFTQFFLGCFIFTLATRQWLKLRHIRHIGEHRDRVPAEFAERISLAAHQKAADYTRDKSRSALLDNLVEGCLLLALTIGGGLAGLHAFWAERLEGILYGLAMILSLMLISALIELPLSLYRQFVIEARHGFNRMTPALFFSDLAKQTLLSLLIGTPVILAVLWLMASMGEHWWLYVWLFWSAFNLLILFIYPTWIAPLFNKFIPLEDGEMKSRIEALLARCGFVSSGLFVMDGSKRSSHGNAYFTGFGKSKRIVFFDTLLKRLSPEETEAVLAHELGHFHHKHILKRIVLMFAGSLFFLWLLGQLIDAPWFYAGLGLPVQNTALGLILFFLVVPVLTFPLTPIGSLLSRRDEFQADAYAAQQANAQALTQALVKLYEDNASTLTPDPLHSVFYDSHPPAALRIARLQEAA